MRIKDQKQNRESRIIREMYARHESQCRRWERQAVAATKCRYRGYFSLAASVASGQFIGDYAYSRLRVWAIFPQGACPDDQLEFWRGIRHWRQAKKLAARLRECHGPAWRPGHWLKVMPWRCA